MQSRTRCWLAVRRGSSMGRMYVHWYVCASSPCVGVRGGLGRVSGSDRLVRKVAVPSSAQRGRGVEDPEGGSAGLPVAVALDDQGQHQKLPPSPLRGASPALRGKRKPLSRR